MFFKVFFSIILIFPITVFTFDQEKLNKFKLTKSCEYCDLNNAQLNDLKLLGSNLQNAQLAESDFSGTDLSPQQMEKTW